MKYDLLNIQDIQRFDNDCQRFKEFTANVELKKVNRTRSL